jgi:hypothetical protein
MRAKIEYFDISMAILNSIVLIFFSALFQTNIALLITNLISIGVLCGLSIITFLHHNPYYFISCYVLAIFGFIFAIGLLFIPELPFYSMVSILLTLILVLNMGLGASLVKGSASSQAKFAKIAGVAKIIEPGTITPTAIKDRKPGTPKNYDKENKIARKLMYEKYKVGLIVLITVISGISFLSTVIVSFI